MVAANNTFRLLASACLGVIGGATSSYVYTTKCPKERAWSDIYSAYTHLHPSAADAPKAAMHTLDFGRASHQCEGIPLARTHWDSDWDYRQRPAETGDTHDKQTPEAAADTGEQQCGDKARASRHLLLVRHGQYNLHGEGDEQRGLTPLGHEQAHKVGRELARMNIQFDSLVRSTMTRAMQTSEAILDELKLDDLKIISTDLLREGAPFPPEPSSAVWQPGARRLYQDSERIEAAFRKFVHRAPPTQLKDSHEVLVCHANVIRYFVCRALQLPPEAWARFVLRHCSVTCITVLGNGRVKLDYMGDAGFMEPPCRTTT